MVVADIMTAKPATVRMNDPLRIAIQRMYDYSCRRLPVINEDGSLVGIITDRDTRLALHSPFVLHERWQDEALLDNVTVRECMTPHPITVEPTMDIEEAIRLMVTYRVGGLPVLR